MTSSFKNAGRCVGKLSNQIRRRLDSLSLKGQFSGAQGRALHFILAQTGDVFQKDLEEEFSTEKYRFVSELHSAPKVYDKQSGKFVKELEKDDFLAYVTEVGEYILTEYVRADGERYGLLLDQNLEILADLPDLCDISILDKALYFDYKNGEIRKCHLYSIQELVELGKNYR